MTRAHASSCLCLIIACAVGCSDGPSEGSGGAPSSGGSGGTAGAPGTGGSGGVVPTADAYCESIVDFFCDFYVRCGRMAVASAEACREPFLESCNASFEPRYVDLEDAGLLALDGDGLAACEAHLAQVACDQQIFELTGPCADVWRGTQPAGAPCGLDVESFVCGEGSTCVLGLDLCGTCRATVAVGQDCSPADVTCEADAFCDGGTCRARVAAGGACTPDDRCVIGASCNGTTCAGPTFVALGDNCDADRRCPYLSTCTGGMCVATGRLGDACTDGAACESGLCSTTCVAPAEDGASCASPSACASGSCVSNVCAPLPSGCFP